MVFLIFVAVFVAPSIVLDMIQRAHIKKEVAKKAVVLSESDYKTAGAYAISKLNLSIFSHIFSAVAFGFWAFFGLNFLESILPSTLSPIIFSTLFVLAFLVINSIAGVPFDIYEHLILDKKFGFNKQNFGGFLGDQLKSLALLIIIGGAIIAGIVAIMESVQLWWLFGFGFLFVFAILANAIYPTLIAPIFNKFTPLEDEALREKIEALMVRVGFKSSGIFVMDASRRDGRLNAYFGGLGKSKRVVLFDTLLHNISGEGLLAILGHELGHFKHKDILKNIAIMGVLLLFLFAVAGHLPSAIFDCFGVAQTPHTTLCILLLIAPAILFFTTPITNFFSRRAEFRADRFGAALSSPKALSDALIRLVNENKSFPSPHPAFVFFYYSHPPLLARLKALESL